MAWTSPATWVDGVAVTAADLNAQIRDNMVYVKGAGARVYNSVAIAIASGGGTALTFDSERYDDSSFHSTSVNTGRLTIPETRRYRLGASIEFASNPTGYRQVYFRVNGTTIIAAQTTPANSGVVTNITIAVDWSFTVGDYVELICGQNSGGSLNVNGTSSYSPEFWINTI